MKVKLKSRSLTLIRRKSSLIREEISPSPLRSTRMSNRWLPQCLHEVQRAGNNRSNPAALCVLSRYLEKNTQTQNCSLRVDFSPFQAASVSVARAAAASCRDRVQDCLCVITANVSPFASFGAALLAVWRYKQETFYFNWPPFSWQSAYSQHHLAHDGGLDLKTVQKYCRNETRAGVSIQILRICPF